MSKHVNRTVPIEYEQVVVAYRKARQGGKAAGVDGQSWKEFEKELESNLYLIWNRMSSGSYLPLPVREVEIPKGEGTKRKLGIPALRDRIAQQVVKEYAEKKIDSLFHKNSYGYRPLKSQHDAIEQVRQNCFKQDWVIDMDISKYFDTIDHELMLKAVEHVMEEKWVLMYVKRWLEMPVQKADGTIEPKAGKGTPQGGVISPLLANLYLHFTFDKWMEKRFPEVRFVRYADDIIIHCQTEQETEIILTAVKARLEEVKLSLNEEKTHTAYCKDYHRLEKHENVKFEFLGMSYQPRPRKSHYGDTVFMAYSAEISRTNQKRIRDIIKGLREWRNTTLPIKAFAKLLNPKIRGWIDYYGKYSKKILKRTLLKIDERLIKWLSKKHKMGFRGAVRKLKMIKSMFPKLFHHWEVGY